MNGGDSAAQITHALWSVGARTGVIARDLLYFIMHNDNYDDTHSRGYNRFINFEESDPPRG